MPENHPTSEQIRDLSCGSLADENLQWVADHVSQCEPCFAVMESLPDDTLVDLLRCKTSTRNSLLRLGVGYQIERELGRGGMGVVYLASQPALGRQVALKMITHGSSADSQELARFRREAQTAASLKHPYIAQVYDVGDQDGQPYIAMELVEGPTLTEVLKAGPLNYMLATRLFIKLADAVGHAHSRGVVHRDLKPSNILMETLSDGEWKPKIVDFGLAKQNNASVVATATGMLLGTPKYMSPEQAAGDNKLVGEASDVHALGAILYETLTGRCPFEGSSPIEILEQVCKSEPVRPRALRPSIPRDLETICLKCLEKNAADRYASAMGLHDDLQRLSDGRAIHAKPTHWTSKVAKIAKRNPTITTLVTCVCLGVTGLLATSLVYNQWLTKALHQQQVESARANENFQVAFGAVDKMLERVGFDQLANQPGMEKVREALLADAVDLYSSLLSSQSVDTQVGSSGDKKVLSVDFESRRQYATALSKLGRIRSLLGQMELARQDLTQAISLQREFVGALPERQDLVHELAISHISLGRVDQQSSEFQKAIDLLRPLSKSFPQSRINLAQASNQLSFLCGTEQREAIQRDVLELARSSVAEAPSDPQLQHLLGQTLHNLGLLCYHTGRSDEANGFLLEAVDLFESLVTANEGVFDYQSSLAESLSVVASMRFGTDQCDEGRQAMDRSTSVRELLVARYPKMPALRETLSRSFQTYAALLIEARQSEPAIEFARKGVAIAEQLNREKPSDQTKFFLASSQSILATALSANLKTEESTSTIRIVCTVFEELLERSKDPSTYEIEAGVAFMNYSNLLRIGSTDEALKFGNRAVDLLSKAYVQAPTRTDLRSYLYNAYGARAQTLDVMQNYYESSNSWKKTIELSTAQDDSLLHVNYALAAVRGGNFEAAQSTGRMLMTRQELDGLSLYNLACLFCLLDQHAPSESSQAFRDIALELLNRPTAQEFLRNAINREQLKTDPDLNVLREDPRFKDLIERQGHSGFPQASSD